MWIERRQASEKLSMYNVRQHDLPAPPDVLAAMKKRSNTLADLAGLPRDAIVHHLREELRLENLPHLARLANAILEMPLSCLSAYDGEYWLTFNQSGVPISLPGRNTIPQALYDAFPIRSVDGLEDFLIHFGGMADDVLPGGFFLGPTETMLVSERGFNWGMIGEWRGALAFYHGTTGDYVVIHQDGYPGKWSHEIGWSTQDDNPFARLSFSFPELIDHFVEHLSLGREDPGSPFYY
jgi:hypothetical protein